MPEDRKRQGLVLPASGVHNTSLPILDRLSRASWIKRREERAREINPILFKYLDDDGQRVDARERRLPGGREGYSVDADLDLGDLGDSARRALLDFRRLDPPRRVGEVGERFDFGAQARWTTSCASAISPSGEPRKS